MKILAIDTASNAASAALTEDNRLLCEYVINYKKTHSETLLPIISRLLSETETDISEVDLLAAVNGPGSFTGLRIGVSTVKGLAHAADKPVVGVNTLMSMAYNLPYTDCIISPIMDARRSQVYNAVYAWENGTLRELDAPRAISLEECMAEVRKYEKKVVFLGDGVFVHRETIERSMPDTALFAPSSHLISKASSAAAAAYDLYRSGRAVKYFELVPFYLRKSQAERELEEREGKKSK